MHTTSITLLERLRRAPDQATWHRLVQLYTPLLFHWARRAGESEHDAADLVQDVFTVLVQTLPYFQYDKSGKFRSWLRTITMNKLCDRKRKAALANNQPLDQFPEPALADSLEAYWEKDYRREVTRRAMQLMASDFSTETWQACWQTVAEGRPVAETARSLGISENAVYIAKCRVLSKLRQELAGLLD